ncbi:hypothetical protein ACFL5J_02320 [Thermodesulfobacteriota bacterium]
MTVQRSYSKIEREIMDSYRHKIDLTESTEDVKKEFVYAVGTLVTKVFAGALTCRPDDVFLDAGAEEPWFHFSAGFEQEEKLQTEWHQSDLPAIVQRLAHKASKRYRHLDKHSDKTQSKICPKPRQER